MVCRSEPLTGSWKLMERIGLGLPLHSPVPCGDGGFADKKHLMKREIIPEL